MVTPLLFLSPLGPCKFHNGDTRDGAFSAHHTASIWLSSPAIDDHERDVFSFSILKAFWLVKP